MQNPQQLTSRGGAGTGDRGSRTYKVVTRGNGLLRLTSTAVRPKSWAHLSAFFPAPLKFSQLPPMKTRGAAGCVRRYPEEKSVMGDDSDIVKEFLIESYENLDRLDQELVVLEKDPANRDTLASIFRTIHTIKGTSGFLGFNQLGALTHAGEGLLTQLRDGLLTLHPEITTALLAMVDAVRQILKTIEADGCEQQRDDRNLIATLTRLQHKQVEPEVAVVKNADGESQGPRPSNLGEILVQRQATTENEVRKAIEQQQAGDPRHIGEILVEKGAVKPSDVVEALKVQRQSRGIGDSTIRVDVSLLDTLMNRVGELVLLRNQIAQYTNSSADPRLLATRQRLNLITTELQESVMKTRMQPIGNVWGRFPRTVRDVAVSCGKQVEIEMQGSDTELDKTIIEAIADPLTHLVRNAVDHGIESPAQRQAAGKGTAGRLVLRAFHEGGQVNIEITDDGAGLNYTKIRSKAVQQGLITADQAARMSDREVGNLIFLPGFSTAEKVTKVSGRGVGLDVVKTNIEKISGVVDVHSIPGQGTSVRIKIPLTLAIIPALIVISAGERYAIPQVNLLELLKLEGERARTGIEFVHGAPVTRLRGTLLPLVYLSRELGIHGSNGIGQSESVNIVVLHAGDRKFGLIVDEINDTEEIVVKPLGKQLKSIGVFAGATIMGDGKLALILDVRGLAQNARVLAGIRNHGVAEHANPQISNLPSVVQQNQAVLLFQTGGRERLAIDLAEVTRLEEFPADAIEITGCRRVVQCRGQVLPLFSFTELLGSGAPPVHDTESRSCHVIVFTGNGYSVGLVVEQVLDIVEERIELQPNTARPGVLGSAIIQQRVTQVLDVPALLATVSSGALHMAAHA